MQYLAYIVPFVIIALSVYFALRCYKKTGSAAKAVRINLIVWALLFVVCLAAPFAATAMEASGTDVAEESAAISEVDPTKGLGMIGAALVTGMSGIGGGIAVAAAAPAAIGATSEDSSAFGKSLIFVALGESIALYGLVISIMILGKY